MLPCVKEGSLDGVLDGRSRCAGHRCDGRTLRALRAPGRQDGVGAMSIQDILVGVVAVGVLVYLFWALLNPERL